jgi:hypothetical protein
MSDSSSPKIPTTKTSKKVREVFLRTPFARTKVALGLAIILIVTFGAADNFGTRSSTAGVVAPVGLGAATPFAVLAGTTITNTGPSVIAGDIGLSPGTSVTGFPPGSQSSGVQDITDATASLAKSDATTAFLDASGRTPFTVVGPDIGGNVLTAGVYKGTSSMAITGTVTLDAQGDPSAVFIFQAGSSLITASNSVVALENGAQACNVFWEVGSSLTLGTSSNFSGTVFSLTSATLNSGANVAGRIIALNGAVTLDDNLIAVPTCAAVVASTTTTAAATTTSGVAGTTTTTDATTTSGVAGTTTTTDATTTSVVGGTTTTSVVDTTPTTVEKGKGVVGGVPTTSGPGGPPNTIPLGAPQTGLGGTVGNGVWPDFFIALGAFLTAMLAGVFLVDYRRRYAKASKAPKDSSRDS